MRVLEGLAASVVMLGVLAGPVAAQTPSPPPPAQSATDLAKQTQNPVSSLVSLPFQFNFNGGGDLVDQTALNVNFQPVIPFKMTSRWNGIMRLIVPMNSLPTSSTTRDSGVGDIQAQLFFSPATVRGIIWGAGPMVSMPTATVAPLQTGTWAAGVGGVIVRMQGPWVFGALIQGFWPVSDRNGDPKTDMFVLQPAVNFNFGEGWSLSTSPVITANWNAASGQRWTIPAGVGIAKVTTLGSRPMSIGLHYYKLCEAPGWIGGFSATAGCVSAVSHTSLTEPAIPMGTPDPYSPPK
jgi:hypothetical protein